MQEFYLTVEQFGDSIFERYIDSNGREQVREVTYAPCMFMHSNEPTEYKDIYGKYCVKKTFPGMRDAKDWMRRMDDMGLEALGMDDYKLAYISDTYRGEIHYDQTKIRVANFDIEVTSPDGFPEPAEAKHPIDAITHYDSIDDKFYVFDLLGGPYGNVKEWSLKLARKLEEEGGDALPEEIADKIVYMPFDDEKELLLEYLNLWEEKTPVVLTGWNVEAFDVPYVYNRLKNTFSEKTAKRLSPHRRVRIKEVESMYGGARQIIQLYGISMLDYIDLYKKFSFTNQPSYSLDYVSEFELKVGKLPYDGPISKLRETNHQRYISYNIIDVYRVIQIDMKRQFINLSLSMGYYAKMQIQSVFSPIKTWDAIIFNSLKDQKKVIPQMQSHPVLPYPGAFVKEPVPNAYKYVMSFDLTSLYPSIIRQVNISPETLVGQFKVHPLAEYIAGTAPRPSDVYSCSPNGMMYDKSFQGVVPVEITKVFKQRKEHKGYMLAAQRNQELIKEAKKTTKGDKPEFEVDYRFDFNDEVKSKLHELSQKALESMLFKAERCEVAGNTAQINRKLLINSLYGALGNVWFRYYDLRNATAITTFGQMALQWIERKVNEYLNKTLGTENEAFVLYGDTDSIYVKADKILEKVGMEKFRDTNHYVDFLDKFARERMEPAIDAGFREMCEYMNNREHLMFMDREAIAGPPLGSDGIGGFWTGKKRYALNVWDMEGTRFVEPKLKIMGLETQKSSTPKAVQKALKECIRRMLQEGEGSLQEYFKEFNKEFNELNYISIAGVSSANNIQKYNDNGFPGYKCPGHIKGVLAYMRATKGDLTVPQIVDGEKVYTLPLREGNPFGETSIAWPSGIELPIQIRDQVLAWMDYNTLFQKTFVKPLTAFTDAAKIDYEKKASLFDMFDF